MGEKGSLYPRLKGLYHNRLHDSYFIPGRSAMVSGYTILLCEQSGEAGGESSLRQRLVFASEQETAMTIWTGAADKKAL